MRNKEATLPPDKGELEVVSLLAESLAVLSVHLKPLPSSPCQGMSYTSQLELISVSLTN